MPVNFYLKFYGLLKTKSAFLSVNLVRNLISIIVNRFPWSACFVLLTGLPGYSQGPLKLTNTGALPGLTNKALNKDSLPLFLITSGKSPLLLGDDTLWTYRQICKSLKVLRAIPLDPADSTRLYNDLASQKTHEPFLRVHGNVQYDYLYRSFVDTPFSQRDFQQHTVQTSLSIVIKDRYPLKLNLSNRRGNSPYFRNFLNWNMQFDKNVFVRNGKQRLLQRIEKNYFERPELKITEAALKELITKYNDLKLRLKAPDILQRIIEEREKKFYQSTMPSSGDPALSTSDLKELNRRLTHKKESPFGLSDLNKELPKERFSEVVAEKNKELDSLQKQIAKLQLKADSIKNSLNKELIALRQKIYRAGSKKELRKITGGNDSLPENNVERFLANVKSFGIGRSMVNYSELTAWNVSLTGLNMEYNPGLYTAFAVGKIDYGFSEFFGRSARKDQSLLMGRIGLGDKDYKAIILSAFTGKKYNYSSVLADTVSDYVNVAGYSLEAILRKDENTGITAEIAKTTKPLSGSFRQNSGLHSLTNFSDNSNLGISVKGQTALKNTGTRLSGFFKKTGESFQSFSLFTYNTDQTAWQIKLDQGFLKNKIGFVTMLRRNDFTNPFTEKTFKTSTIFKSVQVNLRFPKWPVVSAAYYPGTQLYIIDKERIRENAYYILNGSVFYTYPVGAVRMLSSFVYNNYSSKGTDSGFISYSGASYIASQSFVLPKLQLQASYMFTDQEQLQYYTLEGSADYSITKAVRIGGGSKYNRLMNGGVYWGGEAQVSAEVLKLGTVQLQYEKSYLPTIQQTLFPIETGRVSWFKYF